MAEIKVTQALRDTIKKYRKEIHLRGDVLSRSLKKNRGFRSTHSLQMSDEFSLTFRVTESFFSALLVLGKFFCKIFLLANQFSNSIFFQNLQ